MKNAIPLVIALAISSGLSACGGDGGSDPTAPLPTAEPGKPIINTGFRMQSGGGACGANGCGGNAAAGNGAGGVGGGGGMSQMRNVTVVALKPDGTELGRADIDNNNGLVSVYPAADYNGPYIMEFRPKANGEYFDEAVNQWVSLDGTVLHVMLEKLDKDFSANPLTEAAYVLAMKRVGKDQSKITFNIIAEANKTVLDEFNAKLISAFKIDSLSILPTFISDKSAKGTLGNDSAGDFAKVLAAQALTGLQTNNKLSKPALAFSSQLSADVLDDDKINISSPVKAYDSKLQENMQSNIVQAENKFGGKITAECTAVAGVYSGKAVTEQASAKSAKIENWTAEVKNDCSVTGKFNSTATSLDFAGKYAPDRDFGTCLPTTGAICNIYGLSASGSNNSNYFIMRANLTAKKIAGTWQYINLQDKDTQSGTFSNTDSNTGPSPVPSPAPTPAPVVGGGFQMISGASACKADGCGGNAAPSHTKGGFAAGGGLQMRNVTVVALTTYGTELGRADVDNSNGLVSIFPTADYTGPFIFEFRPKANGEYFDPALNQWAPLDGTVLHVMLDRLENDFSANAFTEAAYQKVMKDVNSDTKKITASLISSTHSSMLTSFIGSAMGADISLNALFTAKLPNPSTLPNYINEQSTLGTLAHNSSGDFTKILAAQALIGQQADNKSNKPAIVFSNFFSQDYTSNGYFSPANLTSKFKVYDNLYGAQHYALMTVLEKKYGGKSIPACSAVAGSYSGTSQKSNPSDNIERPFSNWSMQIKADCSLTGTLSSAQYSSAFTGKYISSSDRGNYPGTLSYGSFSALPNKPNQNILAYTLNNVSNPMIVLRAVLENKKITGDFYTSGSYSPAPNTSYQGQLN